MVETDSPLNAWKRYMANSTGTVLLTGAKPWSGSVNPDYTTHCDSATWLRSDIEPDDSLDVVADLHLINEHVSELAGIYSPATLEHLQRPWVAMIAMAKALASGGALFVHTHQTFPLHGYPHDYYRFSTEAMRVMAADAGLEVIACEYDNPCSIVPNADVAVWNTIAESYLNVSMCAVKA